VQHRRYAASRAGVRFYSNPTNVSSSRVVGPPVKMAAGQLRGLGSFSRSPPAGDNFNHGRCKVLALGRAASFDQAHHPRLTRGSITPARAPLITCIICTSFHSDVQAPTPLSFSAIQLLPRQNCRCDTGYKVEVACFIAERGVTA